MLYRSVGRLESKLSAAPGLWKLFNRRPNEASLTTVHLQPTAYQAVVVGYGPIGHTVSRLLHDGGIEPVVIEINLETTRRIRSEGHQVVYGDAAQSDVLEAAGIRDAVALVVSGPTSEESAEIIRTARSLNPHLQVLARSYYLRETAIMREAGADQVFSGEGEVALAMTERILTMVGATPEQMDRERQRVREEVFQMSRGARK
jgi:CPA2 family monovalent cation:H+ antiporter-2